MRRGSGTEERWDRRLAVDGLHLFGLGALAFAQPIFDLLGRNPEFFVVKGSTPFDLLILATALILLVPVPLVALRLAAAPLGRRVTVPVQGCLVAVLLTLVTAQAIRQTEASEAIWVLAPLAGATLAALYSWLPSIRLFATFLAPAILVLPTLFLLQPGVRALLVERSGTAVLRDSGASAPVFFLLLDELGVASLLDETGAIDHRKFPNLAELAEGSTWFRDASSVADDTLRAVPALLTGRNPRKDSLPHLQDHPENLFTLLGGDYDVYAGETHTLLCPAEINLLEQPRRHWGSRMTSLALDVGVLWLHVTLPPRMAEGLPPVDHAWGDFVAAGGAGWAQKAAPRAPGGDVMGDITRLATAAFRARHESLSPLLDSVTREDRSLYFVHLLLPHVPWEYLPSGTRYQRMRDPLVAREQAWPDEESLVAQAYSRHLLQTMYVDRLVGQILDRLRALDVYDRALLVVTADHGATFRAGANRRHFQPGNAAEVLAVPLLIKAPGQRQGRIVDTPVSLVDVLPTLLDILEAQVPDGIDGASVWRAEEPRPRFAFGRHHSAPVPPLFEEVLQEAERLRSLVGEGVTPREILRIGPHSELLGRSLVELEPVIQGSAEIRVDGAERFDDVDTAAPVLPLLVSGTVEMPGGVPCCELAVTVRGVVEATTTTLPGPGGRHRWAVLLPEEALVPGRNPLEVLVVRSGASGPILERSRERPRGGHDLVLDEHGRALEIVADGVTYSVGHGLSGWLGSARILGAEAEIEGWAVDLEVRAPAHEVIFFHRGRFVGATSPSLPLPAVVELFGDPELLESRFEARLPARSLPALEEEGIRAFALSARGVAGELGYFYYALETLAGEGEAIRASNGRLLRIEPTGWVHDVEEVQREGEELVVVGWAADLVADQPASRIVAMVHGRYFAQSATGVRLPSVADYLGPDLELSGFRLSLPITAEDAIERGDLRLFAISRGRPAATEVHLSGGDRGIELVLEKLAQTGALEWGPGYRVAAVVIGEHRYRLGGELEGYFYRTTVEAGTLRISGWAVDRTAVSPAERVAFFLDGRFLGSKVPSGRDPSVAQALADPRYLDSAFEARFPSIDGPEVGRHGVRAFALARRGAATELELAVPLLDLVSSAEGEMLRAPDGRLLPVVDGELAVHLDEARRQDAQWLVVGWAGDLRAPSGGVTLAVFREGAFLSELSLEGERPDVAQHLGIPELSQSGFALPLPENALSDLRRGRLRVFAVSRQRRVATELPLASFLAAQERGPAR